MFLTFKHSQNVLKAFIRFFSKELSKYYITFNFTFFKRVLQVIRVLVIAVLLQL